MAACHFFKHLSYTLSRRLITINPSYSPLTLLSVLSVTTINWNQKHQLTPPTSVLTKFYASPSSSCLSASLSSTNNNQSFTSPTYLSVRIRCQKDVADELSEALLCFGANSASMDEEDGFENSDETYIDSIFPNCSDVAMCISRAADSIGLKQIPRYDVKISEQYDWIKKIQESFHPLEVTKGLWVVPEWRTPPDVQATNIILNPGLAFGTGDHPTTKLCLLLLRSLIKGGELFLDYGTGSGVLAIAALKFGAALSVGIDIDPQAIEAARLNAALNDMGSKEMQLFLVPGKAGLLSEDERLDAVGNEQSLFEAGVLSETEKYDVIIANILLNPLLELADHIVSYAKPGAVIGLSGIISEQVPQIMDRYSNLLEDISISEMDDWACVTGTKKRNF